ncbi:MAG: M17 family metallopeptidase [Phycisphaerales bacterium]
MFNTIKLGSFRSPVHVVGVCSDPEGLPRGLDLPDADKKAIRAALETPGFKAERGETLAVGTKHLVLGLGSRDELNTTRVREIAGRLLKTLDRREDSAVALHLDAIPARTMDAGTIGRCFGEGMGIANWRVDFFDGTATKNADAHGNLTVVTKDSDFKAGFEEGQVIAAATNEARRLGATPPNICNPTWFASEARKLTRKAGLKTTVITYAKAQELGLGGIVNVGRGSESKPNMVIVEHKPKKARRGVRLALVGKTMTYDSGGYSLKLSGGMKGMKYDGCGGYAVLGAMLAIAELDLPVHVVALLPCAENMVNGEAYRPDDIITMHNGVSVEVTNTDAEGRLIMADALSYACDNFAPTAIVDVATLTGGVVVALGSACCGAWCDDDDLRGHVQAASDATDEPIWRMPLMDAHRDQMRAKHADIWNSAPVRDAHPIQGAAFLSYFVDENVPWCHLDIAGVASADSGKAPLYVPGPTGFGVRLLTELAARHARG